MKTAETMIESLNRSARLDYMVVSVPFYDSDENPVAEVSAVDNQVVLVVPPGHVKLSRPEAARLGQLLVSMGESRV